MSDVSPRPSSDALPSRVEVRWGERLLEVKHLPPGSTWRLDELRVETSTAGTRLIAADEVVLAAGPGERVQRSIGGLSFVLEPPLAVERIERSPELDVRFFKISVMALMTFAAVVTAFVITPTDGSGGDDLFGGAPSKRFVTLAPEQVVAKRAPEFDKKPKPTEARERSLLEPKAVDPKQKATTDRQKVNQLMASMFGGGLGRVLGNGANDALDDALKNLQGPGAASAEGLGGMNARGNGAGGPPGGGLSIGGIGGPGRPSGSPSGFGLNPNGKKTFAPGDGPRQIIGNGLEKDVVMAVIRRHQNEIKYCYESRLTQRPNLAGKIAVSWTIDASGSIAEAQVAESGVDDPMVEACMLERIRRWKFPEPKGGGVVVITFPWVFHAAGADD